MDTSDASKTFTTQDQQALQQLVDKYAGGSIRHASKELREARGRIAQAKDITSANAVRHEYVTSHGTVDEADRDRVRDLMRRSHAAKHAEVKAAGSLRAALDEGWLSEEDYARKLRDEDRRTLDEQRKTSRDLLTYMAQRTEAMESFEATASDKEMADVIDRFDRFSAWESAKQRYREMYDAAGIEAKVRMKRENRELHQAVFGR